MKDLNTLTLAEKNIIYTDENAIRNIRVAFFEPPIGGESQPASYIGTTADEDIVSESFRFQEGILDSSSFEVGTYVFPEAKLSIVFNGTYYKGKFAKIYYNVKYMDGETEKEINIFLMPAYVSEELLSRDRKTLDLTFQHPQMLIMDEEMNYQIQAYLASGTHLSYDAFAIFDRFVKNYRYFSMTDGDHFNFTENFFGQHDFKLDPKYEEGEIADGVTINPITYRDFLRQTLEYFGASLCIKKSLFESEDEIQNPALFSSNIMLTRIDKSVNEIYELPFYISLLYGSQLNSQVATDYGIKYKDFRIIYDDWFESQQPSDDMLFTTASAPDSPNIYTIRNNMYFYGRNNIVDIGGTSTDINHIVGWDLQRYLTDNANSPVFSYPISYTFDNVVLDYLYVPFANCGLDNIAITTTDNEKIIIPILNCSVSGIKQMRCTTNNTAMAVRN